MFRHTSNFAALQVGDKSSVRIPSTTNASRAYADDASRGYRTNTIRDLRSLTQTSLLNPRPRVQQRLHGPLFHIFCFLDVFHPLLPRSRSTQDTLFHILGNSGLATAPIIPALRHEKKTVQSLARSKLFNYYFQLSIHICRYSQHSMMEWVAEIQTLLKRTKSSAAHTAVLYKGARESLEQATFIMVSPWTAAILVSFSASLTLFYYRLKQETKMLKK